MELQIKMLLADDEGHGFFGHGRWRLLVEVGKCGSLQEAAENLGMSYRKAWGDIKAVEERLGFAVLQRQRGGKGGGASRLTERGEKLLDVYAKIQSDIEEQANKQFRARMKEVLG